MPVSDLPADNGPAGVSWLTGGLGLGVRLGLAAVACACAPALAFLIAGLAERLFLDWHYGVRVLE